MAVYVIGKFDNGNSERVDYVNGGDLYVGGVAHKVLVSDATDLDAIPDGYYSPGTVAVDKDGTQVGIVDVDGTWAT